MDVNGVLLSHELPSLSDNSDEAIIKKYEPAKFDFLTMSVGNDDQPKEYGSVDEFIQNSLNEEPTLPSNQNAIEDESFNDLVGNSPNPSSEFDEEIKATRKKRGRPPKSPEDKPSPTVAKKRRRSSGTTTKNGTQHPKAVLVEENFREYKLPFGWIKTAHRRLAGNTVGRWDIYLISPIGKRIRSNPELERFLRANPEIKFDHKLTKVEKPSELDDLELRQPKRKSKIDVTTPAAVIGKITTLVPPVVENDFELAVESPEELIENVSGKLIDKKPSKIDKKKVTKLKKQKSKKASKRIKKFVNPSKGWGKKKTTKEKFTCNFIQNGIPCGIPFANVEDLTSHELTHNVQAFECTNCMDKFPTIQDLKHHVDHQRCFQSMEQSQQTSEESLIQDVDKAIDANPKESSELTAEESKSNNVDKMTKKVIKKFIRCSHCQFLAKDKNGMVDHMMSNHFSPANNEDDVPDVEGEISNTPPGPKSRKKGSKTKGKMSQRKKKSELNFELNPSQGSSNEICPYKYADKSICGSTFATKSMLITHYRDHKNDVPCGCLTCQTTNDETSDVKCDYECPETGVKCGHSATCDVTLRVHRAKMGHEARKEPIRCKNCQEIFPNLTILKSHMRKCE